MLVLVLVLMLVLVLVLVLVAAVQTLLLCQVMSMLNSTIFDCLIYKVLPLLFYMFCIAICIASICEFCYPEPVCDLCC